MLDDKTLCLIQAPVETVSGYGQHSRDIVRSLLKIYPEWEYHIASTRWGECPMDYPLEESIKILINKNGQIPRKPDVFIQISVPNEFQPIGNYNIGITAGIETTIASAEFIEGCNRMNLILTPSKFTKQVFENSQWQNKQNKNVIKIEVPIVVLFEGVDLTTYFKTKDISKIDNYFKDLPDFNYLVCGHWLSGITGEDRKDIGMAIKVFMQTAAYINNHKPGLILKTSGANFSPQDETNMLNKISQIKKEVIKENPDIENDLPDVYLLHGNLTDAEMNQLYNHQKVKALISFTKGEGYCRPLAEFSVTGKPILCSNWSGQLEFLVTPGFIPLNGVVKKVHESAVWKGFILPESSWFTVDYVAAGHKIRAVYDNYQKYLNNAKIQRNNVIKNYSTVAMDEKFLDILNKYIPKKPEYLELNLPTLKKIEK